MPAVQVTEALSSAGGGTLTLAGHTVTAAELQLTRTPRAGFGVAAADAATGAPALVLDFGLEGEDHALVVSAWVAREGLWYGAEVPHRAAELP